MRFGMTSIRAKLTTTARTAAARLPLAVLQRFSGRGVCTVLYHAVTDTTPDHLKYLLPCRDVECFRRDLDFLLKNFEPISLSQLVNGVLQEERLPQNAFHLTCDDGLREAAEIIAPICREKGVPATFFLTTGFIGNRYLWHRHLGSLLLERILKLPDLRREQLRNEIRAKYPATASAAWRELLITRDPESRPFLDDVARLIGVDPAAYLNEARPYVDSDDVARLIRDGFTIGAHSVHHPSFPSIPVEDQVSEALESVRQIESANRIACRTFAFPFGADGVEPRFYETVRHNHEIEMFFGVGPSDELSENGCLDRIPLDFDSSISVEYTLKCAYADRIRRRLRRRRTENGRAVL
jgi:peptidoglycan/xylan/chitin deacetylase (PgdA/CDA1 family)